MCSTNEIVRTAAEILKDTLGHPIRLEFAQRLKDGYSSVYRLCLLEAPPQSPQSVIVKQIKNRNTAFDTFGPRLNPPQRFFNEWAALQFLPEVMKDDSPAPRLFGGNREQKMIVIEDFGRGQTITHLLLGNDPIAAEIGLVEIMQLLGRIHAKTHQKKQEYLRIRNQLTPMPRKPPVEDIQQRLINVFNKGCEVVGISPHPGFKDDMEAVASYIVEPGAFEVFSHQDFCPDNGMYVKTKQKLFDFEYSGFGHALTAAVLPRLNFPNSLSIHLLPRDVALRMENAYRGELIKGCPAAGDDEIFYRGIVEACAKWVVDTFIHHMLPRALTKDSLESGHPMIREGILLRLDIFIRTAKEFDHLSAIEATLDEISVKLRTFWTDVGELLYYPAFRF